MTECQAVGGGSLLENEKQYATLHTDKSTGFFI